MGGVNFNEIFALMAELKTIRCILPLRTIMDLEMHQMNAKMPFLNVVLEVEIYMKQPEGFVQKCVEHLLCKLKKVLYKLRQSLKAWYECINICFINKGFTRKSCKLFIVYFANLSLHCDNHT